MSKSYAPVQLYEAKQLSVDILDNPKGVVFGLKTLL
jgi:hypothetical protein